MLACTIGVGAAPQVTAVAAFGGTAAAAAIPVVAIPENQAPGIGELRGLLAVE